VSWFLKAGKEMNFLDLVRATERQRGYGDWYGFMLIAQGFGEVMVEHGVHAWTWGRSSPSSRRPAASSPTGTAASTFTAPTRWPPTASCTPGAGDPQR